MMKKGKMNEEGKMIDKPEEIKNLIIEAYKKKRIPSTLKKISIAFGKDYSNGETFIVVFIKPCFFVSVTYSYNPEHLLIYIDKMEKQVLDSFKQTFGRMSLSSFVMMTVGLRENILEYEYLCNKSKK